MDFAKTAILTGGILSFGFAIGHSLFYCVFKWKSEFEKISVLNRKILYTIHVFLTIFFLIFASISILFAEKFADGFHIFHPIAYCLDDAARRSFTFTGKLIRSRDIWISFSVHVLDFN